MPVYIPSKKQNPKQEPAYRPPPSYENPISSYYDNAQDSVVNTALAFDEDTGGGGLSLARISKNVKGSNRKKRKYLLYQRGNSIIKGEEYDTQKGSKAISSFNWSALRRGKEYTRLCLSFKVFDLCFQLFDFGVLQMGFYISSIF